MSLSDMFYNDFAIAETLSKNVEFHHLILIITLTSRQRGESEVILMQRRTCTFSCLRPGGNDILNFKNAIYSELDINGSINYETMIQRGGSKLI